MIEVFFDGACWPNPGGDAAYGVYVTDADKVLLREGVYLGVGEDMSCNVAEYSGLVHALEFLEQEEYTYRRITIRGDSKLVIKQMSGKWKVKTGLYVEAAIKAKRLAEGFPFISFEWIPREENELCDSLAENALPATKHQAGVMQAIEDFHRDKKPKDKRTRPKQRKITGLRR